jgi:hypothetical protein
MMRWAPCQLTGAASDASIAQVRWMLRRIMKGQERHERRVVLAYIHSNDLKDESKLTLRGLLQVRFTCTIVLNCFELF